MSENRYLSGLVSQCGIKIETNKEKDNIIIKVNDVIVKELTFLEAKVFASELLLDVTFDDNEDYKYHGCKWLNNWCYDSDITVKFKRSD